MPVSSCCWCNALITISKMPNKDEVTVCDNSKCADLEMKFRSQFSDANICAHNLKHYGVNLAERMKRCAARKSNSKSDNGDAGS